MMVDADHFKALNDRHGHLEGDVVLRRIASVLTGAIGRDDRVFRFGGEEFVVICHGLDGTMGHDAAERIRNEIMQIRGPIDGDGQGSQITVSIGVSATPGDGVSLLELISTADRRLYRAKADGRNRVVSA